MAVVGGAISGAVLGFVLGGPWGAVAGAIIGAGMGYLGQAMQPDIEGPGAPQLQKLQLPTASEGVLIFDLLGTSKLTGNIFHYWGNRREEITEEVEGGKGGKGGGDEYVVGYRFYLSWVMGFCLGPVDMLYSIFANDQLVYSGDLARPAEEGEETISLGQLASDFDEAEHGYTAIYNQTGYNFPYVYITGDPWEKLNDYNEASETVSTICFTWSKEGDPDRTPCCRITAHSYNAYNNTSTLTIESNLTNPVTGDEPLTGQSAIIHVNFTYQQGSADNPGSMGNCTFFFGTDDQVPNSKIGAEVTSGLNTPYRGLCYAFFDDCYIGKYNRMPNIKVIIRKTPSKAFSTKHLINNYDYNPAHAIWHIFNDKYHAGLSDDFLNSAAFSAAATTLHGESRGVGVLFTDQHSAKNYIQTVLNHIGGVITYSSGGDLKDEPGNE